MKYLIPCLLQLCISITAIAQCPPNLDFETGTLANWQCKTGTATSDNVSQNFINLFNSVPVPGRHEIISANSPVQKDPYGNFPTLCPYGGNYSVKLGNDATGGEAEGISYTFTIPLNVDTMTFTYFYAVVFQDPQHDHYDQPRFFVTAFDVETGDVINCASYDYVSTSSLPGFTVSKVNSEVLYKNWSPVSLQFFGLNGRDVRLEFKTADCTLGGHFGYAYLDVGTGCSNILATAPYCAETNSLILNAPYGFKDYTWYNQDYSQVVGTGQSITFVPPPATTGTYFVDMVPYPGFGCRDTASATVKPLAVPPVPVADSIFYCQFDSPDGLTAKALPGNDILWYTDTTALPFDAPPIVATYAVDTFEFYVSQKKLFGCESFRTKQVVLVRPTPKSMFDVDVPVQCENGNEFIFTNNSTNLSNPEFIWNFGDGTTITSTSPTLKYSYKSYGYFSVSLTANNQPACSNNLVATVNVISKPVAEFEGPSVICDQDSSITLQDRSNVPGGTGYVNSWQWNIDGVSYSTQYIPPVKATHGGSLPVSLVVKTAEGCVSDTLKKALPIRHKPAASFTYNQALCENELVKFTDNSTIPSGLTDEYVAGWNWTFDNINSASSQHPSGYFGAGLHRASLVAVSNFGCASPAQEMSFLIHPKPYVNLAINDSCVKKQIIYTAHDLNNDVKNWYWDFGDGLQKGTNVSQKFFPFEGDQSFVLLTETAMGCKDTINRKFTIYDNDSYAGDDTLVARNQPVYLNANGGPNVSYKWSPTIGLDNWSVEKPVATLDRDIEYTLYSITDKGCERTSNIFIKRYAGAEIYIPNAFTPNNDGKNDKFMVFPVGFKDFDYVAVYNRYGQQVYLSKDWRQGWDGKLNGIKQDAGNYAVVVKMTDYSGKVMVRKGSLILVR